MLYVLNPCKTVKHPHEIKIHFHRKMNLANKRISFVAGLTQSQPSKQPHVASFYALSGLCSNLTLCHGSDDRMLRWGQLIQTLLQHHACTDRLERLKNTGSLSSAANEQKITKQTGLNDKFPTVGKSVPSF